METHRQVHSQNIVDCCWDMESQARNYNLETALAYLSLSIEVLSSLIRGHGGTLPKQPVKTHVRDDELRVCDRAWRADLGQTKCEVAERF